MKNEAKWPPIIKGVSVIDKGQKVRVKNTHKTGEIVDFDATTATIKFKSGKIEKFALNKLAFLFEQTANSIGVELGSEPTVHDKKFRFNFDSPYGILPLDLARQIGTFLHVDFDKIKVEDLYQRMQDKADTMESKPKTVADWIKVAKSVHPFVGGENENDKKQSVGMTNENKGNTMKLEVKLRQVIRQIIKEIIKEADSKIYVKKGQATPKGKKLQTGPRGGKYFTGSAQEKEDYNKTMSSIKKTVSQKPTKDKVASQKNDTSTNDTSPKFFKDYGITSPDPKLVNRYKKAQDVGDLRLANQIFMKMKTAADKSTPKSKAPEAIKKEYEDVSKKSGNYGADAKLDYLTKAFPKINEKDLEEALFIQQTFANSAPEDYGEMQQASKDSKWFDKFMKKHPELEKIGFDEQVVYDPKTA